MGLGKRLDRKTAFRKLVEMASNNEERLNEQLLAKYLNMSNLKEYNITADYLKDFILRSVEINNKNQMQSSPSGGGPKLNETLPQSSVFGMPNLSYDFMKHFNQSLNGNMRKTDLANENHLFYNIFPPSSTSSVSELSCDCYCGGIWRERYINIIITATLVL